MKKVSHSLDHHFLLALKSQNIFMLLNFYCFSFLIIQYRIFDMKILKINIYPLGKELINNNPLVHAYRLLQRPNYHYCFFHLNAAAIQFD